MVRFMISEWNYLENVILLCRRTLGSERHRYENNARPDILGTGTMAVDGLNKWTPSSWKLGGTP